MFRPGAHLISSDTIAGMPSQPVDLALVGAGAAGLATAIFAARRRPGLRAVLFDGARRVGAKILISGGGRCNVTNREVSASDYWGGNRKVIASVLKAFPASRAVSFFQELGVTLHEEERGKLFPDSGRARTVLDAMVAEAARLGVQVETGRVVTAIRPDAAASPRWLVTLAEGDVIQANRVVLATGGLSVPKTGSDGRGLSMAASLGHAIVPTTPALVPLLLSGHFHPPLSGISHEAEIVILADGRTRARLRGPLLWTHFGISGPVALDASRHWLRAQLDGHAPGATLSFVPGLEFDAVERALLPVPGRTGAESLRHVLAVWLPAAVGEAILASLRLDPSLRLAQLARDDRRRLTHALTGWQLPITGSRGYNYAEATAGGVALEEVDRRTLESVKHPGLHLVGEVLDVDGRLGGFNFQWAWATACVAGEAIARAASESRRG